MSWTPIQRSSRELLVREQSFINLQHTQIPLAHATARTVHHTQGATVSTLYVASGVVLGCIPTTGLKLKHLLASKELWQ